MLPTHTVISLCRGYMSQAGTQEIPIGDYLTKYLLIHISAECEHKIKEMIMERAKKSLDSGLISYIDKIIHIRALNTGDIKGNILRPLEVPEDNVFDRLDDRVKQSYCNIHENRNKAAHGEEIKMSFDEVVTAYDDVQQVLSAINTVINPR